MSAAPNRAPREEVHFTPNVPQTVALKYSQGKLVSGQYGERVMFSTVDGRVFFVSPQVAGQIEAAGVNVREPFTLTQRWDGGKDSPRTWEVARIAGEQRDGTFAVPKLPETAATPKPPASAGAPTRREDGAAVLIAESIVLVDAYAAVLKHALDTHGGRLKPDEVKSIFLTAVINLTGGKRHAA